MSTILETLKKLEEDKRSLDKHLDLKDLVLREDQKPPVGKKPELNQKNMIALVFVGMLIGLALVWGVKPAPLKVTSHFPQEMPEQTPPSLKKSQPDITVGIPLANISEPERRQRIKTESIKKQPPSIAQTHKSVLEPEPYWDNVKEVRDLIQAAKLSAEQQESYPAESAARGISIAGLKVKGIIFFSSGSPSNHIFVSTPTRNNYKVRIGETVQSATLKLIESNRVVFSYQGEMVHLHIGE